VTTRPDALDRAQAALDALLDALRSGRADHVLAVEATLGEAAAVFQAADRNLLAGDPIQIRTRLLTLRTTMARCAALGDVVAEMAGMVRPTASYGRAGRSQDRPLHYRFPV
jgi:D-serine deaminase-like pyridoxal phosphate-dependent protein